MSDARTCKTCRYWVSKNESPIGHCHRMPPVDQPGYLASFPAIAESEWCGEWVIFKGKSK